MPALDARRRPRGAGSLCTRHQHVKGSNACREAVQLGKRCFLLPIAVKLSGLTSAGQRCRWRTGVLQPAGQPQATTVQTPRQGGVQRLGRAGQQQPQSRTAMAGVGDSRAASNALHLGLPHLLIALEVRNYNIVALCLQVALHEREIHK